MAQLDSEPLSQRSCSVSTEISFQLFHGSFFQKSTIAAAKLRSQQHWHWHHHPICYSRPRPPPPFFFFARPFQALSFALGTLLMCPNRTISWDKVSQAATLALQQQDEIKPASLGFREWAELISSVSHHQSAKPSNPAPFLAPSMNQVLWAWRSIFQCFREATFPARVISSKLVFQVFSTSASLPAKLHFPSCHFLVSVSFPAVLRPLHPLWGGGAHHKLLTPCVCRMYAPSLGAGGGRRAGP